MIAAKLQGLGTLKSLPNQHHKKRSVTSRVLEKPLLNVFKTALSTSCFFSFPCFLYSIFSFHLPSDVGHYYFCWSIPWNPSNFSGTKNCQGPVIFLSFLVCFTWLEDPSSLTRAWALEWKCRILTTRPPGNSQACYISNLFLVRKSVNQMYQPGSHQEKVQLSEFNEGAGTILGSGGREKEQIKEWGLQPEAILRPGLWVQEERPGSQSLERARTMQKGFLGEMYLGWWAAVFPPKLSRQRMEGSGHSGLSLCPPSNLCQPLLTKSCRARETGCDEIARG